MKWILIVLTACVSNMVYTTDNVNAITLNSGWQSDIYKIPIPPAPVFQSFTFSSKEEIEKYLLTNNESSLCSFTYVVISPKQEIFTPTKEQVFKTIIKPVQEPDGTKIEWHK